MQAIRVAKHVLRAKVETNRTAHRAIFEEAVNGYRAEAIRLLEEHIARIKDGKLVRVNIAIPEPADHTDDYDRVLAMLDMSVDAEIEIDEASFASYVLDDWHWKRQFLATNSAYSATAAAGL